MSTRRSAGRTVSRDAIRAGLAAALLSGLPSTAYAILRKRDPLEATVAAGSILLPREQRRGRLLMAAIPVHLTLSAAWTVAIAVVLPRRNPLAEGTLAGIVIAALDLGVIGRRFPRIGALQTGPQIADHMAFGIIAAAELTRHEESPRGT
jgi:hypothetical protein